MPTLTGFSDYLHGIRDLSSEQCERFTSCALAELCGFIRRWHDVRFTKPFDPAYSAEYYRDCRSRLHGNAACQRETGEEAASRWRHLPGVPKMRDLGGLKGLGGRTILTGRIYRSGGFNNNACRLYSEEDVMKMYREGTLLEKVPAASRPAAAKIKADLPQIPEVLEFVEFCEKSRRGVISARVEGHRN